MSEYRRRIIDDELDEFQPQLRAIALQGPKAVGKTATASRRARTILDLDLESQRRVLEADPALIRNLPGPVLIDEWQRLPSSWDMVRRAVDAGTPKGHLMLAGSSAPKDAVIHSGAGRIVPFRMRALSLAEREIETPTVSLKRLLAGDTTVEGATSIGLTDYVQEILASGLPAIRLEPARVRQRELDAYIDNIVRREFPQQGYAVRKPETLRAWLTAYAAATSTTTSYSDILDAATPNESHKPAKETVGSYREALSSLWLLDPIPAWTPTRNPMTQLGKASKHHLADPALAARLLGLDERTLLTADVLTTRGTPMLGALFEHLVSLSVQVYAQAAEARVFHFRTKNGDHEVDLIIQRPDGAVIALETKLSAAATDSHARHLSWLKQKLGNDLVASAIITTGQYAYTRPDGIAVIPASLLGP